MNNYIEVPFIEVHQPIGSFYITSMKYTELLEISYADIRKIDEEASDNDNFDTYLGIQRKVSPGRIKEIQAYVNTIDATFPTSVILHIRSVEETLDGKLLSEWDEDYIDTNHSRIEEVRNILIDRATGKMLIRQDERVAQILDGQHRLEGLRQYREQVDIFRDSLVFDLNVTIFVDLDLDDQAQIFSVINKAQTKVNKSLVYDLYEYSRYRSPQKTAHDVVRLLNRIEGSPFYRKIKILGSAEDPERELIAQATFAEAIIRLISRTPMVDRDDLRKESLFHKVKLEDLPKEKYVLRPLFIAGRDEYIVKNLLNYFGAVSKKWPVAWTEKSGGNILNKSTGLLALMRLYRTVINRVGVYDDVISESVFSGYFKKIRIEDQSFNKSDYIPGSSGQSLLYHRMCSYLDTM